MLFSVGGVNLRRISADCRTLIRRRLEKHAQRVADMPEHLSASKLYKTKSNIMKKKEFETYVAPSLQFHEVQVENGLCGSPLDNNSVNDPDDFEYGGTL